MVPTPPRRNLAGPVFPPSGEVLVCITRMVVCITRLVVCTTRLVVCRGSGRATTHLLTGRSGSLANFLADMCGSEAHLPAKAMLPLLNLRLGPPLAAVRSDTTTTHPDDGKRPDDDDEHPRPLRWMSGDDDRKSSTGVVVKIYRSNLAPAWGGIFMNPKERVVKKDEDYIVVPCKYCNGDILVKATTFESNRARRIDAHFERCRAAPQWNPSLPHKAKPPREWDGMDQYIIVKDESDGTMQTEYHELGTLAAGAWRRRRRGPWKPR